MLVIFCEECGGKNIIDQKTLQELEKRSIACQICKSHISRETVISYSGSGNSVDTKNIQLLFIDDESLFLQAMQASMKKDYSVSVALSGTEGIRLAEEIAPDLIFLDVNMPGMSGYEVCSRLKNSKKLRHIPIIFVSAGTDSDDERKGLSLGAVDYISKPIDLPIFHARVAMHIRLKKIQDAHQQEVQKYQDIIASMKKNREKDPAHKYIITNLPEIRKLVTLLTISVDSITAIYKDDKRLAEFNSYISNSAHKLKDMLEELQKIKKDDSL
ncbi:MAG: response regulator [Proteobacteria bacterium]|nr:response regulator [Pseudomonadota bacterium]